MSKSAESDAPEAAAPEDSSAPEPSESAAPESSESANPQLETTVFDASSDKIPRPEFQKPEQPSRQATENLTDKVPGLERHDNPQEAESRQPYPVEAGPDSLPGDQGIRNTPKA